MKNRAWFQNRFHIIISLIIHHIFKYYFHSNILLLLLWFNLLYLLFIFDFSLVFDFCTIVYSLTLINNLGVWFLEVCNPRLEQFILFKIASCAKFIRLYRLHFELVFLNLKSNIRCLNLHLYTRLLSHNTFGLHQWKAFKLL